MVVSEPVPIGDPPPPGPLLRLVRDQRAAFLLVGGLSTGIGLAWFLLFNWLIGPAVGYMGVLGAAHVCAVLCAFVLHRRFVFRVHGHVLRDLARFELVNLSALAVNAALLPLLVEIVGLPVVPAQLLATVIYVVISYTGHRWFSFRRTPQARIEG